MHNWYKFLIKIKPDGKAFRSILFSKIFYEVLALGLKTISDYAITTINDQVWYVNDNFDPEPWERRYQINVPTDATLMERRMFVKSFMMFPQSKNRLSRDYLYNSLLENGFEFINIEYNSMNVNAGKLRANDINDEKAEFNLGANNFNTFILSGELPNVYYYQNAIYLIMSLKPLQVAFYDTLTFAQALAINDNLILAIDDNLAISFEQI